MKILIQSEDYLPYVGGIANHVDYLSESLASMGERVSILSTRKDIPTPRNLTQWKSHQYKRGPVTVTEIPILYSPKNLLRRLQIQNRFTNRLLGLVNQNQCDLVHYHFWDFDYQVVSRLKGRVPLVFTNHSSQFLENCQDAGYRKLFLKRIGLADAVIAPSQELLQKTIDLGISSKKCHYISNGVDTQQFRQDLDSRAINRRKLGIAEDALVLICARRPVPKNGMIYFCEALGALSGINKKIVVLFAGLGSPERGVISDPHEKDLWQMLKKVDKRIELRYLGLVSHAEMPAYYHVSDVSVLPSLVEATSLTGLESMACGLPLVATNIGGIPELIGDRREGLLVPPRDSHALSEALKELIANPSLRASLGENANRRANDHFSWDSIAKKTLKVYQETSERFQRYSGAVISRVRLFTTDSKPMVGGIAEYLNGLCSELNKHIPVVMHSTIHGSEKLSFENYAIEQLTAREARDLGKMQGDDTYLFRKINTYRYYISLRHKSLQEIKALTRPGDMVIIALWTLEGHFWCEACQRLKIPYMIISYGAELTQELNGPSIDWRVKDFRLAKKVVIISRATGQLLQKICGPSDHSILIRPGVDSHFIEKVCDKEVLDKRKMLGIPDGAQVVLGLGRFVKRKGFDQLIKAVAQLPQALSNVYCILVGDGPERATLRELAKRSGLASRIIFLSDLQEHEKWVLYKICDLFVMPNRTLNGKDWEGFGIVYLEAALAGKPSVAGNNGGVPDAIVDGVTGFLVDTENINAIAEKISYLLQNHSERIAMGERAKQRALREFMWDQSGKPLGDYLCKTRQTED